MDLKVGDILEGKVKSITKFGAFVLLPGNRTGMVHISEVSGTYVKEIRDHLTEGQTVRVKMLENEFVQDGERKKKNVSDYLADVQVLAGGKPTEWKLGGENIGPSQTHMWWEYAE